MKWDKIQTLKIYPDVYKAMSRCEAFYFDKMKIKTTIVSCNALPGEILLKHLSFLYM